MARALLLLNGEPPQHLPSDLSAYQIIACTDGAYNSYVIESKIKPHFVIGDLDSVKIESIPDCVEIIETADQNKNDFEKALLFLIDKGVTTFDIYGASGRSSDHFLGNLAVTLHYYKKFKIRFYDNYGCYFFINKHCKLNHVKDKNISLLPFHFAQNVTSKGLKYPLKSTNLTLNGLISLRNHAIDDNIEVYFEKGDLLIFIEY